MQRTLAIAGGILTALAPQLLLAQGIVSDTAQQVAGPLQSFTSGCSGADCAVSLIQSVITRVQMIIGVLAAVGIVRNGITMVYSSQDDEQAKARKAIAGIGSGMILLFLAPRLLEAFYTAGGEEGVLSSQGAAAAGAAVLTEEILGLLNWAQVLVAVSAVTVIIAGALQAVVQFGGEDGSTRLKKTVSRVAMGLLIIILAEGVKATMGLSFFSPPGAPNATILIGRGAQIMTSVLALSTLVALCIIVFAAIMMIVTMGDEEQFKKSRSLIVRAGIGLIVILISWMVVSFVAGLFSA